MRSLLGSLVECLRASVCLPIVLGLHGSSYENTSSTFWAKLSNCWIPVWRNRVNVSSGGAGQCFSNLLVSTAPCLRLPTCPLDSRSSFRWSNITIFWQSNITNFRWSHITNCSGLADIVGFQRLAKLSRNQEYSGCQSIPYALIFPSYQISITPATWACPFTLMYHQHYLHVSTKIRWYGTSSSIISIVRLCPGISILITIYLQLKLITKIVREW